MASDKSEHSGTASPIAIQQHLAGVNYPASKQHIVETAEENKADVDVLEMLNRLPDRQYKSPTEVSREIGKLR